MSMKRRLPIIAITLATLVLLTSCYAALDCVAHSIVSNSYYLCKWDESVGKEFLDQKYDDGQYNAYDLFVPADSSNPNSCHLVLYIHSGAWIDGTKSEGVNMCKYMASKGYVAVSMDYTLNDGENTTNILKCNDEVKKCINAVKIRCHELGYELSDMAVFGFSAGGCQSLMYAFKEGPTSILPVRFVVSQSGPTCFDPKYWTKDQGLMDATIRVMQIGTSDEDKASLITRFSGVTVTADMVQDGSARAVWESISPIHYLDASSVPVLFMFGLHDGLVPVAQQWELKRVLEEDLHKVNGVDFDYLVMNKSGHNLIFGDKTFEKFFNKLNEYLEKYF